jgi:RecB family exonuclease
MSSGLTDAEIASVAEANNVAERWQELAAFVTRYKARLRSLNAVDLSEVVGMAVEVIATDSARDEFGQRFAEVLVDDAETLTPAAALLLDAFARTAAGATMATNPDGWRGRLSHEPIDFAGQLATAHSAITYALPSRHETVAQRLVFCRHPSIEADAVVGELVAARDAGVAWHEMAVVVPRDGLPIGRAVVRALRRRNIPVRITLADGDAEPVVRGLRSALTESDPAAPLADAIGPAVDASLTALTGRKPVDLVTPEPSLDRAIDALVAFNTAAAQWIEQQPRGEATVGAFLAALADPDGPLLLDADRGESDGVAIVSAVVAAGRHWRVAVVPGCVEGEYPRVDATIDWFDAAITTPVGPLELAERRRVAVAEQRCRFGVVASRAIETVFVTAPQPGVLVSRYVQHLAAEEPRPAWPTPTPYAPRHATVSITPMHPTGSLRLSASQLSTFEDCPRRWYYASVLRLDDSSSVWTEFGSLVHNVLEAFLAPSSTVDYSLDALLDLSDDMWTDAVARWAPQREQARRELREILQRWWEIEGATFARSSVVDVELEFEVAVGAHKVRGRIDRVDHDPDRGGVAVVDYKTGRRLPKPDDVEHDVQLAVYYLAALRSPELAAIGPPTRLELLYFRAKEPFFDQTITVDHEAAAEARIMAAAEEMLDEHLDPKVDAECDHCDFHKLCPLQRAGREVGAR